MKHWRIDEVDWDRFDRTKIDPDIVPLVKAAAMVERNGTDYAAYLNGVFADDPDFRQAADNWAVEEVQHGDALGQWAMLADPAWDYATAFARYREGFRIDTSGGRLDPWLAHRRADRPMHGRDRHLQLSTPRVADATEEPVLKQICRQIAADEFRHFKLFYDHMRRYLARENLSFLSPPAHRGGPDHRDRGRRTGVRVPLRQRADDAGLRPRALPRRLYVAGDRLSIGSAMSSAAWA